MKQTICCDYNYLIEHLDLIDKRDIHILLWASDSLINGSSFYQLLSKIKYAEISIGINLNFTLTNKFIHFCVLNHIIVYVRITRENNLDSILTLKNIDKVVWIESDIAEQIDEDLFGKISNHDIHVCLINKDKNYEKVSLFYNKLIANGFSNLFQTAANISSNEYTSFINRDSLSLFYSNRNFKTRDEIDKLSINTLKRYNKSILNTVTKNTEIVFVNLNLSPDYTERKNLGIEYLASILKACGYSVKCLYTQQLKFISEIESLIIENPPLKVIGFSCMQDNMYATINAINYLKNKYSHLKFIIGGAQAIALGESFIRSNSIDYVMVGESEKNVVPLMNYIFHNEGEIEKIFGIRYIDSEGRFIENPQSDLIEKLDSLPFPLYVYERDDALRHAGIITGRGCPFNCSFCYEGAKEKTVRYRSLANVFEEISLIIQNKKNLKIIQFYDDTFTLNKERVLSFCEQYKPIYDKYKINWACEIHCQTVYREPMLIKAMVDCGLIDAQIGLESGNYNILKKLNKQLTPDMIHTTIDICKAAGLKRLEGNILLGGAGENEEQLEEQFAYAEKLLHQGKGMFELNIALFWPYPNTPITKNPGKYGVKILPQQCDYTINSIKNIVTESIDLNRECFVEHYFKLSERIISLYDDLVPHFTASEILQHWGKEIFSSKSRWAQAITKYSYINRYLSAKFQSDIKLSPTVFPIRTFDLLAYRNNCLYIKEANIYFNSVESRILELCNGKNNIKSIATKLNIAIEVLLEQLSKLEERMFIYGSII